MISVDLDAVANITRDVASTLGVSCHLEHARVPSGETLLVSSGVSGTADVAITTLEPGTLYFELGSGEQADWIVRDDADLAAAFDDLRVMLKATFLGSISARGVISADGRRIRLSGPGSPLSAIARLGRSFDPYPVVRSPDG